jgi:hypothetical protein
LKTVFELLVTPDNEIREKGFSGFFERNTMKREFIAFKVVFKLARLEPTPIYQNIRPFE